MRPKDFSELPDLELGEREIGRSTLPAIERLAAAGQEAAEALTAAAEILVAAQRKYQQAMEELSVEVAREYHSLEKKEPPDPDPDPPTIPFAAAARDAWMARRLIRPPLGTGTRRSE